MHNHIVAPSLHPFVPEQTRGNLCHCGSETVESHEFWFCSTECARQDALRALDDPQCHYRDAVRRAQVKAGVPDLYPRRMVSVDQLRPYPPSQGPSLNIPVRLMRREGENRMVGGFPTLSQVTGMVLSKKTEEGQVLKTEVHDRPRWQGFPRASRRAQPVPLDQPFEQISLDAIPLLDDAPRQTLRHVPRPAEGLRNNIRQSVVTFLNGGKFRQRGKQGEQQKIFGHAVHEPAPPVEVDPRSPLLRPVGISMATTAHPLKALRRSASFAGWGAPPSGEDTLMQIIQEMKQEMAESFDPRSLFERDEYDD